jgi:hypothetical protein
MKTSYATTAICLAICIMALVVPTAVGENGPSELAEVDKEERELCLSNRKLLDKEERVLCSSSGKKGGKKGGKKMGKKGSGTMSAPPD